MMCKYYAKKGHVTDYGLSRGYVESTNDGKLSITLYKEHGCYHVKKDDIDGSIVWESFDKLSDARQYYTNNAKKGRIMIIECSVSPNIKGLKIKAKCKSSGQATSICYNSRQTLVENAKCCLVQLCLILGISNKKFVYSIVGDSVLFVSVLSCQSNIFTV